MINDSKKIVSNFGLQEGQTVADLGVGYGHYIYDVAREVGQSGKVFAVDVQKQMIERLRKEVDEKGVKNVEVIWGDIEVVGGTKLKKDAVDVVIVSNVLFQVDSKPGFVHECSRILKVGGRLILIDWHESFGGLGPQTNAVVSEDTARRVFETGPFEYVRNIDAGEHHYGIIFKRVES